MKNSETNYCGFLSAEIEELHKNFIDDREEVIDEQGGYTDTADLLIQNMAADVNDQILYLFVTAAERGVSEENLRSVFGSGFYDDHEDWITKEG